MSNCPVCFNITGYEMHTCGMVSDCDIREKVKGLVVEIELELLVEIFGAAKLSDVCVSEEDYKKVEDIIASASSPSVNHADLLKFYDASSLGELVDKQAKDIKKLQGKLRPFLPDFSNNKPPREG